LDPLLLGSLQAPLINNNQNDLFRRRESFCVQTAEVIIGFKLIGLQQIGNIEPDGQNPGNGSDDRPE
jgi:hypothetical protein